MRIRHNMSMLDMVVRLFAGIALVYTGFVAEGVIESQPINMFLGIFGIANIVAAIARYCPLYTIAHINTNKNKYDK